MALEEAGHDRSVARVAEIEMTLGAAEDGPLTVAGEQENGPPPVYFSLSDRSLQEPILA
jgi:hypothetical protein